MKNLPKKNLFSSDLFPVYSKLIFFKRPEALEPVLDKVIALGESMEQAKKDVELRLKLREILAKEYLKKKRKYAQSLSNKDKLFGRWVYDKAKAVEDDPKYLALKEIVEGKEKTEVFVLLGLIEKHLGGRTAAMKLYTSCWDGNSFDMQKFRNYFTRSRTDRKLGFYYGKRTIKWYGSKSWRQRLDAKSRKVVTSWWLTKKLLGPDYLSVKTWGWWAHDNDEKNVNTIRGGKSYDSYALGASGKLRGGGYGDDWLGSNFFAALPYIKKELFPANKKNLKPGERDSGMSPKKEGEVLDTLADLYKEAMTDKWTVKQSLYRWFTKEQPQNQWFVLPEHKVGQMNQVYGRGCGNYRYRVVGNKIYFLAIQGANFDVKYGIGGYISLENDSLGTWYSSTAKEASITSFSKQLRKDVLDKMSDSQVKAELEKTESIQSAIVVKGKELPPTKDAMSHILDIKNYKRYGLPANFIYGKEKAMYFKKVREALKKWLIEQGYKDDKSGKIATYVEARATKVERDMESYIIGNDALREIIKPTTRIRLKVDSANTVRVLLEGGKEKLALQNKEKEITASLLASNVKDAKDNSFLSRANTWISNKVRGFLEKTKLGKYGSKVVNAVSGVVTAIITQILNLKDLFTDKNPVVKSIVGAATAAIGGGAALIYRGKRLNQRKFDELVQGRSKRIFKKNYKTSSQVDLNGGKIEVALGAAFTPVPGMTIKANGISETVPNKPGAFSGKKWVNYKGKKIVIVGKLPVGFKIKKGFVWKK